MRKAVAKFTNTRPPLRVAIRRPFQRARHGLRVAFCRHDYEGHDLKSESGAYIALCTKCGYGWKVT